MERERERGWEREGEDGREGVREGEGRKRMGEGVRVGNRRDKRK